MGLSCGYANMRKLKRAKRNGKFPQVYETHQAVWWSYLASGEDGHITLTLAEKGQVTGREVILLFCFAGGQIKDTVPYPAARFQHSMNSCRTQDIRAVKQNIHNKMKSDKSEKKTIVTFGVNIHS